VLKKGLIFAVLIFSVMFVYSQGADSSNIANDSVEFAKSAQNKKNPKTASWLSVALPGAGQVYNEKYWKVPIVYGVLGGSIYQMSYNNKQYKRFLNSYIAETDTVKATINEFAGIRATDNVVYYKDQFRRSRDLWALAIIGGYLLNIVDASVDAHFSDFDISDDLTLYYKPDVFRYENRNFYGATVGFYIK
jgi:hypothetical protein